MIHSVTVDCSEIVDWETFHTVFHKTFGFPDYYGRNSAAWIDCMTYLDDTGMSDFSVPAGDCVLLNLANTENFTKKASDVLADFFNMVSFVNWRRIEVGEPPLLLVSADV